MIRRSTFAWYGIMIFATIFLLAGCNVKGGKENPPAISDSPSSDSLIPVPQGNEPPITNDGDTPSSIPTSTSGSTISGGMVTPGDGDATSYGSVYLMIIGGSIPSSEMTVTPSPSTPFPVAATTGRELSISAAYATPNILVGIRGDQLSDASITAQLVSAETGSLVGPRITTGRIGGAPQVASNYHLDNDYSMVCDGYLIVWLDGTAKPGTLYGQRISSSGDLIGAPFPIAQSAYGSGPVIFDGANYFVVWETRSDPDDADTADIYGQFITPSGALLGPALTISSAAHDQRLPAVAYDEEKILIVWVDGRNQSACYTDGTNHQTVCKPSDVYGQFVFKSSVGAAGTLSGDNFLINKSSLPNDKGVAVAYGWWQYFVIMNEETTLSNSCRKEGCRWNVYGRIVAKDGTPDEARIIVSNTAADRTFPRVVWTTRGWTEVFLATWTENLGNSRSRIQGRVFGNTGEPFCDEITVFSPTDDGLIPLFATPLGSAVFVNVGTPGSDPLNVDTYTDQDVMGLFLQ